MATATFIHDGNAVDYTPTTDVAGGAVVVQGDLIGVAKRDILAGTLGALAVTGVFDLPRGSGGVISAGMKMYWDEAQQQATTEEESGANKYFGKTVLESWDTTEIVRVRLSQ